ncbi:LapA family protein [Nitrincola tapanii]|uniref:LapA family protein n=1 Tax=Nitrincola tapanii TaxID=1708751 RepID=A0A5A9VZS1_9GAMM|nr:LapA family protein [Nitrincola tapanii]
MSLVVLLAGILFAIHNTAAVSIDLIFITLPEASLSMWLLGAFALGGLLGVVLSSVIIMTLKTRLYYLKKKMNAAREQLDSLSANQARLDGH